MPLSPLTGEEDEWGTNASYVQLYLDFSIQKYYLLA